MSNPAAIVAYNTSELLTLRHSQPRHYQLITQACGNRLQMLGHLDESIVIDERYLASELEGDGISAVVLPRQDIPAILGMIGSRIERVGHRFCLTVQRPYLA